MRNAYTTGGFVEFLFGLLGVNPGLVPQIFVLGEDFGFKFLVLRVVLVKVLSFFHVLLHLFQDLILLLYPFQGFSYHLDLDVGLLQRGLAT